MLGICDLERGAKTRSLIPLSAPLEGVLDYLSTGYVLRAVLGQGAEAAEELQNQIIGLADLAALAAGTAVEPGLAVKSRVQRSDTQPSTAEDPHPPA